MAEQTFHLRGEYDLVNAFELEAELLRFAHTNGGGPLIVDGEHLEFIDSTGIGALLRVREALVQEGRRLRVVHLPPTARRAVEVLHLEDLLGDDDS